MPQPRYGAMVSSDWSECLSPNGPFDVIGYHYPELRAAVAAVFRQYTGNTITLGDALDQVAALLPSPITAAQMDAYLDEAFATYPGVPELIARCLANGILFMINTTGMIGYFQRVLAKGLLPPLPALSANDRIRFDAPGSAAFAFFPLTEIGDKASNSAAAAARFQIPLQKVTVMGDSGGDGPHFHWGARIGARLIGCMVKPSLAQYCQTHGIAIHHRFGHAYRVGEERALAKEMGYDYGDLWPLLLKA